MTWHSDKRAEVKTGSPRFCSSRKNICNNTNYYKSSLYIKFNIVVVQYLHTHSCSVLVFLSGNASYAMRDSKLIMLVKTETFVYIIVLISREPLNKVYMKCSEGITLQPVWTKRLLMYTLTDVSVALGWT